MIDPAAIAEEFRHPSKLWTRTELMATPCPIPSTPGIYGWYFDELPEPGIPSIGTKVGQWWLLYIGIAPARQGSLSNLRKRLRTHLSGSARKSTLRLSLGSLLSDQLGLSAVPASGKVHFGQTEALLSSWLDEHARIAWVERARPWEVEAEVVHTLLVPMNRDHNQSHPFYAAMGDARKTIRRL